MDSTESVDAPTARAPVRRPVVSKGDRQRENILEAFERLLGTIPVSEMTVKDITEAAGIKRPNFYFYFESKYDVLGELVNGVWDTWGRRTGGFHRRGGEAQLEYFERLQQAAYSTWVDHGTVMVAGLRAVELDERLGARWLALIDGYKEVVVAQLTRDTEAGLVRPVSDDYGKLVALLLDLSITSFYQDRRLQPPRHESDRMLATVKRIWAASMGISSQLEDQPP